MAHKKGVGSSRNGRDSAGRRLGVKVPWWSGCFFGDNYYTPARHKNSPRQ